MYDLLPEEKAVLLLGMDDRLISPAEIEKALKTKDLLVYNSTVTKLRNMGILESPISNPKARLIAKKANKSNRDIGRFRVVIPGLKNNK